MTIYSFLKEKVVHLWVTPSGRLGYRGPEGALTREVIEEIKKHKAELIELVELEGIFEASGMGPVEILAVAVKVGDKIH